MKTIPINDYVKISSWINSCDTLEQLGNIMRFVYVRYGPTENGLLLNKRIQNRRQEVFKKIALNKIHGLE